MNPEVAKVIEELEKEIYTPSGKMTSTQNRDPSTRPRISPTYISENEPVRKALATFIDNSLFSVYEFYVTYTITITLNRDETVTVAGKGYPITYRNMKTFNKNWQLKEYLPAGTLRGSTKFWLAVATVIYAWLTYYVLTENRLERSMEEGELAGGEGAVILLWMIVNFILFIFLLCYISENIGRFNQFLDKHL